MSSSTLIEVFGHIVFSFTRGVTEHYNPEESEYTSESFRYNPLESTEREWYHQPIDEFIYQECGREAKALDYLASAPQRKTKKDRKMNRMTRVLWLGSDLDRQFCVQFVNQCILEL